jgi:hypothetical protein
MSIFIFRKTWWVVKNDTKKKVEDMPNRENWTIQSKSLDMSDGQLLNVQIQKNRKH